MNLFVYVIDKLNEDHNNRLLLMPVTKKRKKEVNSTTKQNPYYFSLDRVSKVLLRNSVYLKNIIDPMTVRTDTLDDKLVAPGEAHSGGIFGTKQNIIVFTYDIDEKTENRKIFFRSRE